MQADTSAYLRSAARSKGALSVVGAGADTYTAPTDDEHRWQDSAACAEVDPDLHFPEKGGRTREAKKTCKSCFVKAECLEYALDNDERFGIWGGLTERERRKLKRANAEVAA
jgi:WhiB family transcriptional regulator, redox-sensing transcriptional regulator